MSKVIFGVSVSLDGHANGSDPSLDQPMGAGGDRLHDWASGGNEADRGQARQGVARQRRDGLRSQTYDLSISSWDHVSGGRGPPHVRHSWR